MPLFRISVGRLFHSRSLATKKLLSSICDCVHRMTHMAPDIMERLKASAKHQLYLALLPFTHARSECINDDSLNSIFLQLGRRSGGRPQPIVYPRRLPVSTLIHTRLAGIEPTTFQLLVRHATSRATETTSRRKT